MYPYRCEDCQTTLKLTDQHLGRKIRCPRCRSVLEIPECPQQPEQPSTDWTGPRESDFFSSRPRGEESVEAPSEPPAPEQDGQPFEYDWEFPDLPTEPVQPTEMPGGTVRGINWGTVVFGVGLMVVAAVWFVAGLVAGVIFFYPPILLIVGLVTLIKGLFGYE